MPVIDVAARPLVDPWVLVEDAAPLPGAHAVLSLTRFLRSVEAGAEPSGVSLMPDEEIAPLLPHLGRLALIAVVFPKFRDGRGFTIARKLRLRHAYRGDLRAAGDLLPDQLAMLRACGFTTIITPPSQPPERWQAALPAEASLHGQGRRTTQLLHRIMPRPAAG